MSDKTVYPDGYRFRAVPRNPYRHRCESLPERRNLAIDMLRALTMFIMIFVNDFWKVHAYGYLSHRFSGQCRVELRIVAAFPINHGRALLATVQYGYL